MLYILLKSFLKNHKNIFILYNTTVVARCFFIKPFKLKTRHIYDNIFIRILQYFFVIYFYIYVKFSLFYLIRDFKQLVFQRDYRAVGIFDTDLRRLIALKRRIDYRLGELQFSRNVFFVAEHNFVLSAAADYLNGKFVGKIYIIDTVLYRSSDSART